MTSALVGSDSDVTDPPIVPPDPFFVARGVMIPLSLVQLGFTGC
ncbi:hypothetical protein AB0C29_02445 [Actinoplanes sp. NPDC048791]